MMSAYDLSYAAMCSFQGAYILYIIIGSRQILSFKFRHPPAFPYRLQYSIIGRLGLNHRVRDENGCVP